MSSMHRKGSRGKAPAAAIDLREQLFNNCEVGKIQEVSLPVECVTSLHGVLLDIDPRLFNEGRLTHGAQTGPKSFFEQTVQHWLRRHPVLEAAEVRRSGTGLHLILRLEQPQVVGSHAERMHWATSVPIIQAVLPVDPAQPGINALTRPLGSINSKNDRKVILLSAGKPIPVADLIRLEKQMLEAPFRTVMGVLFGRERVSPCPICAEAGSELAALDQFGCCYAKCGNVPMAQLYGVFLRRHRPKGKEARHVS